MTHAAPSVTPAEVLAFWFGSTDATDPRWFKRSDAFDAAIRERFGTTVESALAGRLDGWAARPPGALALIVLLDQFTRNIHRGTPAAFAGDAQALTLALQLVDSAGSPTCRWSMPKTGPCSNNACACSRRWRPKWDPTARRWPGRWTMRGGTMT